MKEAAEKTIISAELEEAVRLLTAAAAPIVEKESVPLREACRRILAEDIRAAFDQPPFPRSPLDGYAVRAEDTAGASESAPVLLQVIAEVDAGGVFTGTVGPLEAVRIMTGAPIPEGADAIIRQEDTDCGEDEVRLYCALEPRQNYCEKGEDYHAGTLLLQDREYIGPVEAGILASTGRDRVLVYRRPRAVIISTGDEVVMPGQDLTVGKIYDSNLFTIDAQLRSWGVDSLEILHVNDDAAACAELITARLDRADLILTTGGVSVGKRDIMHEVFQRLDADRLFWKVRIKPGMAMLAGTCRGRLILSLSGNPFAAYADLHLMVRPVIAALNGSTYPGLNTASALMAADYSRKSPARRFVRALVRDGIACTEGHTGGNGVVSSGRGTNALIEIEAGSGPIRAGDRVKVIML